MKKTWKIGLVALLAILLGVLLVVLSNPLRRSEEQIRASMLKLTPIGTTMTEVTEVIESNKKWSVDHYNNKRGYGIDKWEVPSEGGNTYIGSKSIRIHIGGYRNLFITDVVVFYGFDENDKLVGIAVRKDTDSI